MSMPKGYKSDQGYATVSGEGGGMDYRTIAEIMSENGHKMNHATARNIFLQTRNEFDIDDNEVDVFDPYGED